MLILEDSPLNDYADNESLEKDNIEIILMMLGTAAATGNSCEYRASYPAKRVRFNHRFHDVLSLGNDGTLEVDLTHFHLTHRDDGADVGVDSWRPQCS